MLLTLSHDLLYLVSYHLSLSDWFCLIQCHSYFRFLTCDMYWQRRLQHDTNSLDYVRAKPDSVTWPEWYLISRQQLRTMYFDTYQDEDVSFRPWYTSHRFVVDMLGQAYFCSLARNNDISLHKVDLSFRKMIGMCLMSHINYYLIISNKQELLAIQGLFTPNPDILLLYSKVTEAVHLQRRCDTGGVHVENGDEHVIVISVTSDASASASDCTTKEQLFYFRGSAEELISPSRVWNDINLRWEGRIKCLSAYFSYQMNRFTIELITTDDETHRVATLGSFGWYSGIKPNKLSYVYALNSTHRPKNIQSIQEYILAYLRYSLYCTVKTNHSEEWVRPWGLRAS